MVTKYARKSGILFTRIYQLKIRVKIRLGFSPYFFVKSKKVRQRSMAKIRVKIRVGFSPYFFMKSTPGSISYELTNIVLKYRYS